jgi:inosine/xanthosine triphosphatase
VKEHIVVASMNGAKLQATRDAFAACFPGRVLDVHGVPVPSGVAEQPLTDEETLQGARNRAMNAREASPHAHYWVGLEGGIDEAAGEMRSFAWVFILGATGQTGKGRTATLYLPPRVMELIRQGKELGEADDIVFGVADSNTKMIFMCHNSACVTTTRS